MFDGWLVAWYVDRENRSITLPGLFRQDGRFLIESIQEAAFPNRVDTGSRLSGDAHRIKSASSQRCKQKAKVLKVGFEPQRDGSEDLCATKTTSWRRTTYSETDSQYIFLGVLRPRKKFCRNN